MGRIVIGYVGATETETFHFRDRLLDAHAQNFVAAVESDYSSWLPLVQQAAPADQDRLRVQYATQIQNFIEHLQEFTQSAVEAAEEGHLSELEGEAFEGYMNRRFPGIGFDFSVQGASKRRPRR